MKKIIFLAIFLVGVGLQSCNIDEFLNPSPRDSVFAGTAMKDRLSVTAAMNGLYSELQDADLAFDGFLAMPQYFSDECNWTGTFPTRQEFGALNVFPANTTMAAAFSDFYDVVNYANYLIANIPSVESTDLTDAAKNSFVGQARFVRAFVYFQLVNMWQDPPLITAPTSPDAVGEELYVSRSTTADVYNLILDDLAYAKANVTGGNWSTPSALAAAAMMSRAHLYLGNWQEALDNAEEVITSGAYELEGNYKDAFNDASSEAIWYLKFNQVDANSNAFFYYPASKGGRLSISPSQTLISAYEAGDVRYPASIDTVSFHGDKYDDIETGTDPLYFIRYAEVLLNAAEAAAELGDFATANTYYNEVRARAGLAAVTLDASNFEANLLQERFVELAMEGGHRLFDLRRRGQAEAVLGPIGYDACDNVWPYPQRDIDRNPNLAQNACCNC